MKKEDNNSYMSCIKIFFFFFVGYKYELNKHDPEKLGRKPEVRFS